MYFSRFARHHRLGFFGRFSHHFVSLRDAHNFFDGCFALRDASPAVLPQSFHAFDDGTLLELAAIAFSHDQLSKRFSDGANFIDRRATLIAGLAALITAGATLETACRVLSQEDRSRQGNRADNPPFGYSPDKSCAQAVER